MRALISHFLILIGIFSSGLVSAVTPMVAAGGNHTVALKTDGIVDAWGLNDYGQLGDGTTINRLSPVVVVGLGGVLAVGANLTHSVALKTDGTLMAWGKNSYGQLGDGTTTNRFTPVAIPDLTGVGAVAAGGGHTVALKADGTVVAWGNNAFGQLGDGTTINRLSPVAVVGLDGVVAVAAGGAFTVALKSDGTVVAWGYNYGGALGDGTRTDRHTPVAVSGLTSVVALATGDYHTVALKSDGTVVAWGWNVYGQLGDGTTVDRLYPVAVPGLAGVVSVSARDADSLALKSDGTVAMWGADGYGQLGDRSNMNRSSPVLVTGLSGVEAVAAGGTSTVALKSDGAVVGWGYNGYGQLGDGTLTNRFIPVMVPGYSVNKISQTVGFGSAPTVLVGGDSTVSAIATSGLAVILSTETPNVCTISGSTITGVAFGTCTIVANQPGDANFNTAPQVKQSVAVVDSTPNVFNFIDQSGVPLSTVVTSTPVQITGICCDAVFNWTASGGTACVSSGNDCSCNVAAYAIGGTVMNNQFMCLQHTSSSSYATTAETLLTVGVISDTFSSITPPTIPDVPTAATAIGGNVQAWVSFSAPTYDGGSPIAGYTVTSNPAGGVDSNAGTATLTHKITGLLNGTSYTFTVHATNAIGDSLESAASAAVTPTATPPITDTSLVDNGDGTVTDSATGLTWMRCAMGQTWDGVTCTGTASSYTWDQAMGLSVSFAGYSDWRMPDLRELQSIVDLGLSNSAINGIAFPLTPANYFWSASSYAPQTTLAWSTNFSGGLYSRTLKTTSIYVRLVRAGHAASLTTPIEDFSDNGDGTVTHFKTGLIWMRCAVGQTWNGSSCSGTAGTYTWGQAVMQTPTFAGHSDWRLPNRNELASIVEFGAYFPAINGSIFPGTPFTSFLPYSQAAPESVSGTTPPSIPIQQYFWSSTSTDSLIFNYYDAWSVNFNDGQLHLGSAGAGNYVRLVRGGNLSGSYSLTVSKWGGAAGKVISDPAGIDCGATCAANFNKGSGVSLVATPDAGSAFTGWSGPCHGPGACVVSMDAVKSVTAYFATADTTPAPFTFAGRLPVPLGVLIESDAVTISGINTAAPISISSCTGANCAYSTDGGANWQTNPGTVTNDKSVKVRLTSSPLHSAITTLTLNIGGVIATFSVRTVLAPPGVDVIATALSTPETTVITGATMAISDTVQNQGGSYLSVSSIVVKYYLSTDAAISATDKLLGQRSILASALTSALTTGASNSATTVLKVPATVLPAGAVSGVFYVGAIVDATNAQTETNEANNTRASGTTITVRRAGVDLAPAAVSISAASVMTGAGLTVTDTVENLGASNMTAASILVKYFLSADAIISATDKLLGQRTIGSAALVAGAGSTASTTFTIPASMTAGAYYVGEIVDATNLQVETNETNNTRNSVGTINVIKNSIDLVSTAVGMVYTQLAAGSSHTVALKDDGTLWAWGSNATGQLGDGSTTQRKNPVQIGADTDWTAIATGANHTLALKTDGTLWAWGGNASGQLGDGSVIQQNSPVQVGADTDWAAIAAGNAHSLAIKTDGTLWVWGSNTSGQLGDGTTTQQNTPVPIGTDTDWLEIAAGSAHTVARKSDGTLWAWGSNSNGQLGDGSIADSHAPQQVGADTDWAAIAAGSAHTAAIKSTGTLWAWGSNASGQLGDNTTTQRNSPVHIGTGADWLMVAAGAAHTAAIKSTGALWAWGSNANGRLGDGTTLNRLVPKQISASGYADVAAGAAHTAALKGDETLWAWGYNATGQLGDGTVMQRLAPVAGIPTVAAGSSLVISDTVKNQGTSTMTAPSITVKYYLSTDALITAMDKLLGQRTVSALAAGASDSATTPFIIPLAVPSGTYYIGEMVDTPSAQAETNETNNARAGGKVLVHH